MWGSRWGNITFTVIVINRYYPLGLVFMALTVGIFPYVFFSICIYKHCVFIYLCAFWPHYPKICFLGERIYSTSHTSDSYSFSFLCFPDNCGDLWWLILCVSLIRLTDAQIASKTLSLRVSMRVFPEYTRIWIGRMSKEDSLTSASGRHPIHWGPK